MIIQEKVVVISGGASGLGAAVARRLAARGAQAALLDINEENGAALCKELGNKCCFLKTDITSAPQVQAAINKIVDRVDRIDIVVNCAGIPAMMKICSQKGPHDLDYFKKVIEVNLVGPFNVMRLALVKMLNNDLNDEGGRGVIINTASIAAFEGQIGQAAYAASKGALAALTLPAARDLATEGIRVVAVAPGIFDTPMLNVLSEKIRDSLGKMAPFPSRLGKPDEFAQLVQHIIENPMLNGETIRIDGAMRMAHK
ncbi:MAG: SDR family NAD(P)-dependent oxidoreductase [Syntrophomonadaceae bacterium]|jgi:3-hydroxyacyl-CoA dehydrogenase/3-hydroxy-2-methylbutyryl-CoA dehydrogenase